MPLIRILSDSKAGDLVQCRGVAEAVVEAVGGTIEYRFVRPRAVFAWTMPWSLPDPRDAAALAPPWPDLAIASGRRTVPYLKALKRRSPATLTVFLKDPYTGPGTADLIWVPEHDRRRGPNVIATPTSPHRLTPAKLTAARVAARPELLALPQPRVAVLLGGASRDVAFGAKDIAAFSVELARLAESGVGLMVSPSRRTPPALIAAVRAVLAGRPAFVWDGEGRNPYLEMMALADCLVVTADSANMLSEAAMTGRPILAFAPAGLPSKLKSFLDILTRHGAVAKFAGHLESFTYPPLDSTPLIAREIVSRLRPS
ncbi:mitochondrial fission ELM1 family protein [Labrys wisconsinensis]|uniref:Mitochondrial fission protein ELM1 n=1 Tax=Labrys wisconsinensis TaxID=425677 RepID=A0ABU0J842_9HYPH|nr:mitochondrial fission ELM1 family protein [Labrys wisconsinensis]MDQ0470438.1 mitochondrial fission protein ELM1 [Labrys wisconsinensis]